MSGKFLKLGVLGLSVFGLFSSFLILLHYQGLSSQNFILSQKLKEADVDYNYDIARLYLNESDPDTAKIYFVESLNANPLYTKSLVDLSEVYLEQDNYDQSELLLKRAHYLSPYSFKLIWRMAILSLWIEEKELAMELLNTISKVDSGKVFDLAWRVFDDEDLIYNQLVNKNNIKNYMNFLMAKNEVDNTYRVWERLTEYNNIDDELQNRYLDFLIKNDEFLKAGNIWNKKHGKSEEDIHVWNGSFESKPIQHGFGWIIKKSDHAYVGYDWDHKKDGKYSLFIEFDGKDNLSFNNISKIVPVKPASEYELSYFIKTEDLTTTNGIYSTVSCYPNSNLYRTKTPVVNGTNSWKKIQENVLIPEKCNALKLVFLRDRSKKLDKFISGKVWIDNVKLSLAKNEIN